MKRLGRNERIGAAVLAAVSLAIVLLAFLSRRCSRSGGETDAVMSSLRELTEIRGGQTDSLSRSAGKAETPSARSSSAKDSATGRKQRRAKEKAQSGSRKDVSRVRKSSPSSSPRDFLEEKIPVRENPDSCAR
ncbi:MAG: hypothetical protein K2I45_02235 [Muribaculaceae bacterium]|nr:hypothetical protein [Muribaculaceae bacterium]MDE6382094.1 hypothetical protein [Muribaculaceae bacterium]